MAGIRPLVKRALGAATQEVGPPFQGSGHSYQISQGVALGCGWIAPLGPIGVLHQKPERQWRISTVHQGHPSPADRQSSHRHDKAPTPSATGAPHSQPGTTPREPNTNGASQPRPCPPAPTARSNPSPGHRPGKRHEPQKSSPERAAQPRPIKRCRPHGPSHASSALPPRRPHSDPHAGACGFGKRIAASPSFLPVRPEPQTS